MFDGVMFAVILTLLVVVWTFDIVMFLRLVM
jgi:hypothetical protein